MLNKYAVFVLLLQH